MEELKICNKCNIEKTLDLFPKSGKNNKVRACCKECWNSYNRKHYKLNKNKYIETRKEWKNKNKNSLKIKQNEWRKNKLKNDLLFNIKCRIRSLISINLKKKNIVKKSKTVDILGCDYEFFKSYIESQFTKDMNWQNIHLDHIKPMFLAKTEEEIYELNHYTNFQPLLFVDNLIKSNKLIEKTNILV